MDLTQGELADLVGTHEKTVGKWERGLAQPRGRNVSRVERALEISLDPPPPAPVVRVARPSDLTNEELANAAMAYLAEMSRRMFASG